MRPSLIAIVYIAGSLDLGPVLGVVDLLSLVELFLLDRNATVSGNVLVNCE